MKIAQKLKEVIEKKNEIKSENLSSYETIKKIVESYDGKVEEVDVSFWDFQENGDGEVELKDDKHFIIKIPTQYHKYSKEQKKETELKKAFVVAHEFGHYILGHLSEAKDTFDNGVFKDTRKYRNKIDFTDRIEMEAEAFAYRYFIDDDKDIFAEDYKNLDIETMMDNYGLNIDKIEFLNGVIALND